LRSAEAVKLSILQHDMDTLRVRARCGLFVIAAAAAAVATATSPVMELQCPLLTGHVFALAATPPLQIDVEGIDEFHKRFSQHWPRPVLSRDGLSEPGSRFDRPEQAVDFMRSYPDLIADADRLLGKPLKTAVDVRFDDFERYEAPMAWFVADFSRACVRLLHSPPLLLPLC
jgi:hypothetical protein